MTAGRVKGPVRILLCPDSGPGIGGGHVMRTLSLADALVRRGAVCTLACEADGVAIAEHHGRGLFRLQELEGPLTAGNLRAMTHLGCDAVVFDGYRFGPSVETEARGQASAVMVIDDLADRMHDCDLLLDSGYGRLKQDYAGLVRPGTELLMGPVHALLRPAFARVRSEQGQRDRTGKVDRVFISFGLSDVGQVAARVYGALRAQLAGVEVDLALAGDAPSLPELLRMAERDAGLHLHVNATDVVTLMGRADVAIGAGGGSTWERACLGLPTLAVIVAENQRDTIERLTRDQVLLSVDLREPDFDRVIRSRFNQLVKPRVRQTLSNRVFDLCDGQGADRVAEALLAHRVL